eukprot:m.59890 g.59890  ORF g.59890 m.59890 type:complete len:394 (-) comp11788_c0_seq3:2726-3907(-)
MAFEQQVKSALQDKPALLAILGPLTSNISSNITKLQQFATIVASDTVNPSMTRDVINQLASDISQAIKTAATAEPAFMLGESLLPVLPSRNFEEALCSIRLALADRLQELEQWANAAKMLSQIDLNSSQRVVDPKFKAQIYIRIAGLYIENDEAHKAETYTNRAALSYDVDMDSALKAEYQVQMARIDDSKRKFVEAGRRYLTVSFLVPDESLQETALTQALTCAILAPAGPQRSRLLATLYQDERCSQLANFSILEAMHLGRIVTQGQLKPFSDMLLPHQRATTAKGKTILEEAMLQHNLLSATKVYTNISLEQLGGLLQVSAEEAEDAAAEMIAEGRMQGSINQQDGFVDFVAQGDIIRAWDKNIGAICQEVASAVEAIRAKHPNLVKASE